MAIHISKIKLDEIDEVSPLTPPHSNLNSSRTIKSNQTLYVNYSKLSDNAIRKANSVGHGPSQQIFSKILGFEPQPVNNNFNINVMESNSTIKATQIETNNNITNIYNSHLKQQSSTSQETQYKQNLLLRNPYLSQELQFANGNNSPRLPHLNFDKFCSLIHKLKLGLFDIIKFFTVNDIKQFYDVCKKFRLFLNISLRNVYFNAIIPKLRKNKRNFDVLRTKIHYTKVKKSLKIDLIITIRFMTPQDSEKPNRNVTIGYIHKYDNERLIDYYSFDIVDKVEVFPSIYMTREFTTFNLDHLQKTYIQPVLPFKSEDKGMINIQIYSPEKGFVNHREIKIKYKIDDIVYKTDNSMRVCEYEELCSHWKNISFHKAAELVIKDLRDIFEPEFEIRRIQFEDVGYFIFKVVIKAVNTGLISNKQQLGINLKIRDEKDLICNEIKKNDLLFEMRNVFELRLGDVIIFYLTNNK